VTWLRKGLDVQKHGRRGRPHVTRVQLSADGEALLWVGKSGGAKRAELFCTGGTASVLTDHPKHPARSSIFRALCVSIGHQDKTLHLMCENAEQRQRLLYGLFCVLHRRGVSREPPELRAGAPSGSRQNIIRTPISKTKSVTFMDASLSPSLSPSSRSSPAAASVPAAAAAAAAATSSSSTSSPSTSSSSRTSIPLGDVYVWGQLPSDRDVYEPERLVGESTIDADSVSLARNHGVVLSRTGAVYAWGVGEAGRLGSGDWRYAEKPRRILFRGVVQIAAVPGGNATAALTQQGETLVWGEGGPLLGLGKVSSLPMQCFPKPIVSIGEPLIHISFGGNHAAAVGASGAVYSWGEAGFGALGTERKSSTLQATPSRVEALRPFSIGRVACGTYHTAALSRDGSVLFTWGDGSRSQLGRGGSWEMPAPAEGLTDVTCVDVSAGLGSTLVLVRETGAVMACGRGLGGLGESGGFQTLEGELVGMRCAAIACGEEHSAVVSEGGALFTWGSGRNGRLGHGAEGDRAEQSPRRVLGLLSGVRVLRVSCGARQTAAVAAHPPLTMFSHEHASSSSSAAAAVAAAWTPKPPMTATMTTTTAAATAASTASGRVGHGANHNMASIAGTASLLRPGVGDSGGYGGVVGGLPYGFSGDSVRFTGSSGNRSGLIGPGVFTNANNGGIAAGGSAVSSPGPDSRSSSGRSTPSPSPLRSMTQPPPVRSSTTAAAAAASSSSSYSSSAPPRGGSGTGSTAAVTAVNPPPLLLPSPAAAPRAGSRHRRIISLGSLPPCHPDSLTGLLSVNDRLGHETLQNFASIDALELGDPSPRLGTVVALSAAAAAMERISAAAAMDSSSSNHNHNNNNNRDTRENATAAAAAATATQSSHPPKANGVAAIDPLRKSIVIGAPADRRKEARRSFGMSRSRDFDQEDYVEAGSAAAEEVSMLRESNAELRGEIERLKAIVGRMMQVQDNGSGFSEAGIASSSSLEIASATADEAIKRERAREASEVAMKASLEEAVAEARRAKLAARAADARAEAAEARARVAADAASARERALQDRVETLTRHVRDGAANRGSSSTPRGSASSPYTPTTGVSRSEYATPPSPATPSGDRAGHSGLDPGSGGSQPGADRATTAPTAPRRAPPGSQTPHPTSGAAAADARGGTHSYNRRPVQTTATPPRNKTTR